jgi:hypothetical protein
MGVIGCFVQWPRHESSGSRGFRHGGAVAGFGHGWLMPRQNPRWRRRSVSTRDFIYISRNDFYFCFILFGKSSTRFFTLCLLFIGRRRSTDSGNCENPPVRFGVSSNRRRILPKTETVSPLENKAAPLSPCLIGRNRRGLWVVRDPIGMCGGLFLDRAEAFRFALRGSGRPHLAVIVPYPLELDAGKPASSGSQIGSVSRIDGQADRAISHG